MKEGSESMAERSAKILKDNKFTSTGDTKTTQPRPQANPRFSMLHAEKREGVGGKITCV